MIKSLNRALVLMSLLLLVSSCRTVPEEVVEEPVTEPVTEESATDTYVSEDKASDPMVGTWTGNRYYNSFFDINMTVPEDWHRFTEDELNLVEATGSAITEATTEVINLVGISARPLDSQALFNPSLLVNTYATAPDSDLVLMDLILEVRDSLQAMDVGFTFEVPSEVMYFEHLTGVELRMSLAVEGLTIYQSFFVANVHGWMVEVTATYSEEDIGLFEEMTGR